MAHMTKTTPVAMDSLPTQLLQTLQLEPADHPLGQCHMSAASGLVRVRQRLYVVADDALHLGIFNDPTTPPAGAAPASALDYPKGSLLRLLDGDLPQDQAKRKKLKPDFESLVHLPPLPG